MMAAAWLPYLLSAQSYQELMEQASTQLGNRELKNAKALYQQAAAADTTRGEPWYGIYRCTFNDDEQLDALNNAIRRQPDAPVYYEYRGYLYNSMGKQSERIADFRRWVQLAPKNGAAHAQFATALNQENPGNPEIKEHFRELLKLEDQDNYHVKQLKKNFPSLYAELSNEPGLAVAQKSKDPEPVPEPPPPPVPAPARKKVVKEVAVKKSTPSVTTAPAPVVVDEAASRLLDSCAAVFSSAIDTWAGQMASRSDIITAFTSCGSSECRQAKFGDLNRLLSAMSDHLNHQLYRILFKNDSRLNACSLLGKRLADAKWKLGDAGNQYESAATFAINLKKDYDSYSTDQRGRFIELMFGAYDKADVLAQEGMKQLMDAYDFYLAGNCANLKAGASLRENNPLYQSLASAQQFLKIKLENNDRLQQHNLTEVESQQRKAENTRRVSTASAGAEKKKAPACSCCKGKGYVYKQEAEFHKMGDKRVERVKKIENGKAITEVSYEPIGYTKYRSVKSTCTCCNGSGEKQ